MPKTLHRQEGLKIVQNDKNGFVIATLLFTADPRKRDPRWIKEASRGPEWVKIERSVRYRRSAVDKWIKKGKK